MFLQNASDKTDMTNSGAFSETSFNPDKVLASTVQELWLYPGRKFLVPVGNCLILHFSNDERQCLDAGEHIITEWKIRRIKAQYMRVRPIRIANLQTRCKEGLRATLTLSIIPSIKLAGPMTNLAMPIDQVKTIIEANICTVIQQISHNKLLGCDGNPPIDHDQLSFRLSRRLERRAGFEGLDFQVVISELNGDPHYFQNLSEHIRIQRQQKLEDAELQKEITLMDRRLELEQKRQELRMLKMQEQMDGQIAGATARATMGQILLPLRKQEYEMRTRLQAAINQNQFTAARELFPHYAQLLQQYRPFMRMDSMMNIPAHAGLGVEEAMLQDIYRQGVEFLGRVKNLLNVGPTDNLDWLENDIETEEEATWPDNSAAA